MATQIETRTWDIGACIDTSSPVFLACFQLPRPTIGAKTINHRPSSPIYRCTIDDDRVQHARRSPTPLTVRLIGRRDGVVLEDDLEGDRAKAPKRR